MKVVNRTGIVFDFEPIVKLAATAAKAKIGDVGDVVLKRRRAGKSMSYMTSGLFRATTKEGRSQGQFGWPTLKKVYRVTVTMANADKNSLNTAESFFSVLVHEFAHSADKSHRLPFEDYRRNWKNRPHEVRAAFQQREVMSRLTVAQQDAILDLAIILEQEER